MLNLYFPKIAYFHRMNAPITIHYSVLLWLLLWAGMPLCGAQRYPYIQLTTADGLPTNYVYGVVEDADGYIWAYTENGLAKYDGYSFRNFTTQDGLPGNDVVYAKADSLGRIWLEVYANRPAYVQQDSIFTFINRTAVLRTYKGEVGYGFSNTVMYTVGSKSVHYLYQLHPEILRRYPTHFTLSHSVAREGRPQTHFESYPYLPLLTPDSVHYYRPVRNNWGLDTSTWVIEEAGRAKVLWKNPDDQWQEAGIGPLNLEPIWGFKGYVLDERFVLIMKTLSEGVVLDRHNGSLRAFDLRSLGIRPKLHSTITVEEDHFWCNSDDGMASFAFDGSLREVVRVPELCENYLLHRIYKDRAGNIWMGSQEGGLFLIPYTHTRARKRSLPRGNEAHFEQLLPWGDGRVLGLTAHAGVYELWSGEIRELRQPMLKTRFRSALKVEDELWVSCNIEAFKLQQRGSTWQQQAFRYGKVLDTFRLLRNDSTVSKNLDSIYWFKNNVDCVYQPEAERIWGMYSLHTLYRYDQRKQQLAYLSYDFTGSRCLHYDTARQRLLIGYWDGIRQWDEKRAQPFLADRPQLKNVAALYGTHGKLWIGTEGNGLFCYHYATDSLERIGDVDFVRRIRPGPTGTLLIAGSNGVLVVEEKSGSVRRHFTQLDGLPGNETEDVAAVDSTTILVATVKGLYELALDFPPMPALEASSLRIVAMRVNDAQAPSLLELQPLSHQQNNIRFDFHLQHIISRGQITYHTRLAPLEADWQTQMDRSIHYPGLQPGAYQFYLKATDHYGRTVSLPPFDFRIEPAWWQTPWFKAALWALGLLSVFLFSRWRLYRDRRKLVKEKVLNKRLAELELNALRAQMNPHFVFNALGAIQYFIQTHEAEAADNYLTMFAALMRRYLDSSRRPLVDLQQEVALLDNYTQLEMMRFEGCFQTHITVAERLLGQACYLPSMLVQPFVENAINHGLCERSDGQGILDIRFEETAGQLRCTITDNGIGRARARQQKRKGHQSQGMKIVREKIDTLRQSRQAEVELSIEDSDPEATRYPGTKVTLTIKMLDDEPH